MITDPLPEDDWEKVRNRAENLHEMRRRAKEKLDMNQKKEELKKKHDVGNVDPAHVHQAKKGNVGRAVMTGLITMAMSSSDGDDLVYPVTLRPESIQTLPLVDHIVTVSADRVSEELIEENDVVALDLSIENRFPFDKFRISSVNGMKLIHEDETQVIEKIERVEERIDESFNALEQLVDLREKDAISETEFRSQFEAVIEDGLESGLPPAEAVDYVRRLDVYREADTITDTEFERHKEVLLNRPAMFRAKIDKLSASLTDDDVNKANEILG